jgi:hypothetical protein
MGHKRISQRLGVQLPSQIFTLKDYPQYQRDVIEQRIRGL